MDFANILQQLLPYQKYMPTIPRAPKHILFEDRVGWTACALLLYVIMSNTPLYGAYGGGVDALYHQRLIMGSNRNTVMALGISPLLTACVVLQLMSKSRTLNVGHFSLLSFLILKLFQFGTNFVDRKGSAEKLLALAICLAQAVFYVASGTYGTLSSLGAGNAILVVVQVMTFLSPHGVLTSQPKPVVFGRVFYHHDQ